MIHKTIISVTQRITERSQTLRAAFMKKTEEQKLSGKGKASLSCGNLAHAVAASCSTEKANILNFSSSSCLIRVW